MERYLFMRHVLQQLSQSVFFRKAFSLALRSLAFVIILAGLSGFVRIWNAFSGLPGSRILGGIIFEVLFVIALYMVVHTIFIRARQIAEIQVTEYAVTHVFSIFSKLAGEAYAAFSTAVAVGGGIFIWFAGAEARDTVSKVAPFIVKRGDASFAGGVEFMLGGILTGLFVLACSYLLSEFFAIGVSIARNAREVQEIAQSYDKSEK